jgi:hypothetical protein
MPLTVKGLCFNVIFIFASLHVQSLLLFSADNGLQQAPSLRAVEDPRNCIKSFLRLRGGSQTSADESSGKYLTFKIRCSNTRWGQSGFYERDRVRLLSGFCVILSLRSFDFTALSLSLGDIVGSSCFLVIRCVFASYPRSAPYSWAAPCFPPAPRCGKYLNRINYAQLGSSVLRKLYTPGARPLR